MRNKNPCAIADVRKKEDGSFICENWREEDRDDPRYTIFKHKYIELEGVDNSFGGAINIREDGTLFCINGIKTLELIKKEN